MAGSFVMAHLGEFSWGGSTHHQLGIECDVSVRGDSARQDRNAPDVQCSQPLLECRGRAGEFQGRAAVLETGSGGPHFGRAETLGHLAPGTVEVDRDNGGDPR